MFRYLRLLGFGNMGLGGFRSNHLSKIEVYCQSCGKVLTNEGGDVGDKGIYCHGYKEDGSRCLNKALRDAAERGEKPVIVFNYFSPIQVRREIKKGRLRRFKQPELETLE